MELSLSHTLHLFNNCAQVLEEEISKMFCTKYLNDEHDCNVVSTNSLNIHDTNDMQIHKLGDTIIDEYDIFSPPSLVRIFIMMKTCLFFMMIILMKVFSERS